MDATALGFMAGFPTLAIAAIIFTILGIMVCKSKKVKSSQIQEASNPKPNQMTIKEVAVFHTSLQISVMSDIITATKRFSCYLIIGRGRFRLLYKVVLPTTSTSPSWMSSKEFRSELEILKKLRHRNIERILRYCVPGANKIQIYESSRRIVCTVGYTIFLKIVQLHAFCYLLGNQAQDQ